jgi:hypothetical protein
MPCGATNWTSLSTSSPQRVRQAPRHTRCRQRRHTHIVRAAPYRSSASVVGRRHRTPACARFRDRTSVAVRMPPPAMALPASGVVPKSPLGDGVVARSPLAEGDQLLLESEQFELVSLSVPRSEYPNVVARIPTPSSPCRSRSVVHASTPSFLRVLLVNAGPRVAGCQGAWVSFQPQECPYCSPAHALLPWPSRSRGVLRSPAKRHHNLPAHRVRLIGREHDLQVARRALLSSEGRLLTLTGTGGCGKPAWRWTWLRTLSRTLPTGSGWWSSPPCQIPH